MSAQGIAQNYLLALMAQPLLAYSALSDVLDILEDYGPDELDEAKAAVQQYYTDNGLAVDLATLNETLEALKSSNLAFWAGVYHIPHPDAGTLRLSIVGDTVTLVSADVSRRSYFSVPFAAVSFNHQTLSYEDDTVRFSARLWCPSDMTENATMEPVDMAQRNEARLTGTLSVKGDKPEGPYALTGKRGVCTAAGFSDPGYGDPAPVWAGRYQTQYVDGDFSFPGTISISVNADGSVAFSLGDLKASAAALANNTLVARLPTGTVIALQLMCAPSGVRGFTGAVEADGITRRLVGTCPVLYAADAAPLPPLRDASDAIPGFCDTNNDQVLTLAQLGAPVEALTSLSPVPVVYADGSRGTILITPTRAADVYRVPPGAMVAYRPPTSAQSDAELQVGWQVDEGYTLLRMIEPAYYQLRVSLSDARSADRKGIDIAMALDAPDEPGFLTLLPPTAPRCGPGTGGADSPVEDFTIASVLLANAKSLNSDGVLKYLFALSGKSASPDNAERDHDSFLCATLTYEAADGSQKYPPRLVRVPLLCAVSLPVTLTPPLTIEGMTALPAGYPNRPASATLSATGGVQPIAWTSTSATPDGLAWAPSNEGASFTLSGTLGALPEGWPVLVSVSAQSDPTKVVSSIQSAQGALPVSEPPAASASYAGIGWIAGAIIFCGGAMALDAMLKWGVIDGPFLAEYVKQKRLMLNGGIADMRVIFDERAVRMPAQLKETIAEYAEEVLAQMRSAVAKREDLFRSMYSRLKDLADQYKDAATRGNQGLADELQRKAEAFSDEVARVGAELLELRRHVTTYSDDIDRITR